MPKPPHGSITSTVARAATAQRLSSAASVTLLAIALALGATTANAEPDDANDPVSRLLIERGLVPARSDGSSTSTSPAAGNSLAQRVRNKASDMVITAMNFLGVPYRRGGSDADDGFDCSGFTRHVFEMSLGLVLPRRVDEQAQAPGLTEVQLGDLRPGDLVFFNTLKRTFSHVGIYVGDGKFIHSPRSGASVRVEDMRYDYWAKRFTGARRASAADAIDGR